MSVVPTEVISEIKQKVTERLRKQGHTVDA